MRILVRRYVEDAAAKEWPMMARKAATLATSPPPLADALRLTLTLAPNAPGQQIAQREIATSLESALEARGVNGFLSADPMSVRSSGPV